MVRERQVKRLVLLLVLMLRVFWTELDPNAGVFSTATRQSSGIVVCGMGGYEGRLLVRKDDGTCKVLMAGSIDNSKWEEVKL